MATKETEGRSTLTTANYHIEFDKDGTYIYTLDEKGDNKQWLASTTDPETATRIVEGLVLVEHKRFYHPETEPVFTSGDGKPLPPFLKKGTQAPETGL